jgi:hypothetical protein
VGARLRPCGGRARALRRARRRRGGRPRRDIDGRPQSRAGDCAPGRSRRRAHRRRCRDVVRRDAPQNRCLGDRCVLQLFAEGTRRAVRAGAPLVSPRTVDEERPRAASTWTWRSSRTTGSAASITTRSRRRSSTPCARH